MRRYAIFAISVSALLLSSINSNAIAVAFPALMTDLNTSLLLAGWVLSVYQLVNVSVVLIAARFSDCVGRKATFLMCVALFTIGSGLCAIAPNVGWLIIFRIIQAVGGGGFLPAAAGVVSETFPNARQAAIGLFSSIMTFGSLVGPNLGGWMVSAMGWKSIFWINAPLGCVIMVLAWRLIEPDKTKAAFQIDLLGAGILTGFLSSFMIAITLLGNKGGIPWGAITLLALLGIALLIIFVRWERKAREPILHFDLIMSRAFMSANVYNFAFGACILGASTLAPFYATSLYGMSIFESGLLMTPRSFAALTTSTIAAFLLMRVGYRRPIVVGTLLMIASLGLMALEPTGFDLFGLRIPAVWILVLIMLLNGAGTGMAAPAANNACIELMPEHVAAITGMRAMFRQLGGAMAINIGTLLLDAIGDLPRAFTVVFAGVALMMLLVLPAAYLMPSSPRMAPASN